MPFWVLLYQLALPIPSTAKGKIHHTPLREHRRVLIPSPRPWARRWRTTNVCDTWPVRRQTYGYLPSRKALPPTGWYQIILLGDRGTGTCVLTTCPGLHSIAARPGSELATYWSQVQRPNHSATEPTALLTKRIKTTFLPCREWLNFLQESESTKQEIFTSGSNNGFILPASSRFQSIDLNNGCACVSLAPLLPSRWDGSFNSNCIKTGRCIRK